MREGCNAETCQKRAPGPPCGMWPVCLPRKNRAGEREERGKKGKRGRRPVLPHHRGERGGSEGGERGVGDKERSYRAKGRRVGKVRVQWRAYGTLLRCRARV